LEWKLLKLVPTPSGIFKVTPSPGHSNLKKLSIEDFGITCKRNLFEVTCEESSFNKGICVISDENSSPITVENK